MVVGCTVGDVDGNAVGLIEGIIDGDRVGDAVGNILGARAAVGESLGRDDVVIIAKSGSMHMHTTSQLQQTLTVLLMNMEL